MKNTNKNWQASDKKQNLPKKKWKVILWKVLKCTLSALVWIYRILKWFEGEE